MEVAYNEGPGLKKLTGRQRKFVQLLAMDPCMTKTDAARQAGFKNPRQSGSQLLNRPEFAHVQAELKFQREERAIELSIDSVLERLAGSADSTTCFDEDGSPRSFAELTPEQVALLKQRKVPWTVFEMQVWHSEGERRTQTVLVPNFRKFDENTKEGVVAQRDADELFARMVRAAVRELLVPANDRGF